jgi:hypothetical protein
MVLSIPSLAVSLPLRSLGWAMLLACHHRLRRLVPAQLGAAGHLWMTEWPSAPNCKTAPRR